MTRRLAALAALVMTAGLLVGLLFLPRKAPPAAGSPEVQFTQMMIQHHMQAVDMALRIRQRSRGRTLRSIALDIELSQQEQIRQMRGWLRMWHQPQGVPMPPEHARMMGMASPAELNTLGSLPVPQAETQFLKLMIRHHQGALEMVKPVLGEEIRPEVRYLARQMSITQKGEIFTMQQLLKRLGDSSPAQTEPMPGMQMTPEHQH